MSKIIIALIIHKTNCQLLYIYVLVIRLHHLWSIILARIYLCFVTGIVNWENCLHLLMFLEYCNIIRILQKQVVNKNSLCKLLANDLVITIWGLLSDDVWLSVTLIPSIVIECLKLFLKSLLLGLADTFTGILGGLRFHDWLKSSASFLLIYIGTIKM